MGLVNLVSRDPLDLLAVVVRAADAALGMVDRCSTSDVTLKVLRDEVRDELGRIRETPLIDDKADMLLTALLNASWCDADAERVRADEWRWIARAILPFVRTQHATAVVKQRAE